MNTTTERLPPMRGALSAAVVVAIYALLLIGAPFLLRYGPEPEVSAAVASVAIGEVASPRCAHAPEYGRSCMPDAPVASVTGKAAVFVE